MSGRYPKFFSPDHLHDTYCIRRRHSSINYSTNALSSENHRKLGVEFLADERPEVSHTNSNTATSDGPCHGKHHHTERAQHTWLDDSNFKNETDTVTGHGSCDGQYLCTEKADHNYHTWLDEPNFRNETDTGNIHGSSQRKYLYTEKAAQNSYTWLDESSFENETDRFVNQKTSESEEFYTPLTSNDSRSPLSNNSSPSFMFPNFSTSGDDGLSFRSARSSLSNLPDYRCKDSISSGFCASSTEEAKGISEALQAYSVPFIDRNKLLYPRTRKGTFKMIGAGSYGNVYLAELLQTNGSLQPVAVKKFEEDEANWKILQEGLLLKCLEDTEYTPICYGISKDFEQDEEYLGIVQEYLADGLTLEKFLQRKPNLPREVWLDLVKQLTDGLERIHNKGVIVNDIKANNILLDENNLDIYFIDFGLSTLNKGMTYNVTHALFKSSYLAPEVRMGELTSFSADVYSLGYVVSLIQRRAYIPELNDIIYMCCEENKEDRPPISCVKLLVAGV